MTTEPLLMTLAMVQLREAVFALLVLAFIVLEIWGYRADKRLETWERGGRKS